MQDITDRLDAELRTPPPPTFDVVATVGAGRRAVRRRRLARGGAALALLLVVGGAGLAVTSQFGGPQVDGSVPVAAGVSDEGLEATSGLDDDFPAGYDPQDDRTVLIRDGWEVIDRIEDPVTGRYAHEQLTPIDDSLALGLRKDDVVVWIVLFRFATGTDGTSSSAAGGSESETQGESGAADLRSWLAARMSTFTTEPAR